MDPTNVSPLSISISPYKRVGDSGWVDSSTPINAANLNKSDDALFNLLNDTNGYIYQIVDKLNDEIDARTDDSTMLKTYVDDEVVRLRNNTVVALDTQVNKLTAQINSVSSAQSHIYNTLSNKYETVQNNLETEVSRAKGAEDSLKSSIPTKVSQLENDVGYLTKHQDLTNYVTIEQLESKNYVESETFATQGIKTEDELLLNCGTSTENMFD